MQQLNSPKGNHVARICLVPKTSMYIHLRASEVSSGSVVLCFEWFTVQSQSITSELLLSHQSPPLGGHLLCWMPQKTASEEKLSSFS